MRIKYATATGADDSINPDELFQLAQKLPLSEWGILISKNQTGERSPLIGGTRFPSKMWMKLLRDIILNGVDTGVHQPRLAGHLCGQWVRDLCERGDLSFVSEIPLWDYFSRIQLNFHGIEHRLTNDGIEALRKLTWGTGKSIICQVDGVNDDLFKRMLYAGVLAYPLFDKSHGAGVLPVDWNDTVFDQEKEAEKRKPKDRPVPSISPHILRGYAGGLSPNNLEDQLKQIEKLVGKDEIWVDFETEARSGDDRQFDLTKVENFVKIAQLWA